MIRSLMGILPAGLLVLALTACTGDAAGSGSATAGPAEESSSTSEEPELIAWADEFCAAPGAIPDDLNIPFMALSHNQPTVEADRQPLIDALTEVEQALVDAVAVAEMLPPGPTPEAEAARLQYRENLEAKRTKFVEYLQVAPDYMPADLDGLFVLGGLDLLTMPYPLMMAETYLAEPTLAKAAEGASTCGGTGTM